MKKALPLLIIGGIILAVIIGFRWYIGGLNRVVQLDENVNQAWAEVENQLKRRNDLIPNLVSTIKGYASHEKELFTSIAESRSKLAGTIQSGAPVADRIEAAGQLQGALSRLLMIVERYPDLKANQNFLKLQDELAGTENRISVARTRYNRSVRTFNTYIRMVFGSYFAKKRGLTNPHPYFEIDEADKEVPKVEF